MVAEENAACHYAGLAGDMFRWTIMTSLHPVYIIAQVAVRYYAITRPDKELSVEQARKNFFQDKKIDEKVLLKVLTHALQEQKKSLKNNH